jgi:predicted branched-subunit amino acid permease
VTVGDGVGSRVWDGVRAGVPYGLATLLLGVSFGALAAPVMGGPAAVVMSAGVVSGGAQAASLGVLAGGGGAVAAILAGVLVNARWLPLGVAAAPFLGEGRWSRAARAQAIVDASFVLAARGRGGIDRNLLVGAMIPQATAWIVGTVSGVLLGPVLGDPHRLGLDGLFVGFYASLLWGDLRQQACDRGGWRRPVGAAVLGAAITLALLPVAPVGVPVLAAAAACLVGLIRPARPR